MTIGMPALLAALIMGITVNASFGATMIPSTPRATKLLTCSNCRLASPSEMASMVRILFRSNSAFMMSKLATHYSVCNVSNATPTDNCVLRLRQPPTATARTATQRQGYNAARIVLRAAGFVCNEATICLEW